jgi:hypothetical protein
LSLLCKGRVLLRCVFLGAVLFALALGTGGGADGDSQVSCSPESFHELGAGSARLKHCRFAQLPSAPPLAVVQFSGALQDTAALHGWLLGHEASQGIIQHVRKTKERYLESLPAQQQRLMRAILSCFVKGMRESVDAEWLSVHKGLAQGFAKSGITSLSMDDVIEMGLSNELGSMLSGMQRQIKRRPIDGYARLVSMCGPELAGALLAEPVSRVLDDLSGQPDWGLLASRMGCTGFASAELAQDDETPEGFGPLWMARNLDGSAIGSFERKPLVVVHDPRPLGPSTKNTARQRRFRYVGVASAGLHYAGGNAGFNEAGLGVTLHEMETEAFRIRPPGRKALPAVYLQNRILERASSIDEAWNIVRNTPAFSAWTIVVGDAKTGEVAAFEFSARRSAVARRVRGGIHTQANHFIAPQLKNDFYNYSYNKVLESRFRIARLQDLAAARPRPMNAQWLLDTLSEHVDWHQGPRSFGRNLIKTNTMMTVVMAPGERRLLASLADRYPVGSGHFFEVRVDFDALDRQQPVVLFEPLRTASDVASGVLSPWQQSLGAYVEAYLAYKAAPNDAQALRAAQSHLSRAEALAEESAQRDFAYRFMSGKLSMKAAGSAALRDDDALARLQARQAVQIFSALHDDWRWQLHGLAHLHPYDAAQLLVWWARAQSLEASLGGSVPSDTLRNFAEARDLVQELLRNEQHQDFELRSFLSSFWPVPRTATGPIFDATDAAAMSLDFVTVE